MESLLKREERNKHGDIFACTVVKYKSIHMYQVSAILAAHIPNLHTGLEAEDIHCACSEEHWCIANRQIEKTISNSYSAPSYKLSRSRSVEEKRKREKKKCASVSHIHNLHKYTLFNPSDHFVSVPCSWLLSSA